MVIRFPATESEFEAYYAFRWRILRGPWILEINLNLREDAVQFYRHNGYQVLRPSHTLFGVIPHFEMRKRLL